MFSFGGAPATPGPAPAPGAGFGFGAAAPASGQPAPATNAPAPGFSFSGAAPAAPQTPAAPAGGFSFGGAAPTPAATAAAPGPSFAFGSTAANTPAPGTFGPPAPAPGATAAAPATPAAPAPGGFSFGGATAAAPAMPAAPAAGGFSFGGAKTPAGAAPAPAAGAFGTPAAAAATPAAPAAGGFSFGGKTPAATPAAPAAGAFSYGGTTPATTPGALSLTTPAASTALTTTAPAAPTGLQVPDFRTLFPNEAIYCDLRRLLVKSSRPSEEGRDAALEIMDCLQCTDAPKAVGKILSAPKTLKCTGADNNVRNQLRSNPSIVLPGNREATLPPEMQAELYNIADDLKISEKDALVLFYEAGKADNRVMLEEKLVESIIDKSMADDDSNVSAPIFGTNVVKAAKELYFFERQRCLQTILLLAQHRIEAPQKPWGDLLIQATDQLLQNKLIENLISLVRDWTGIIGSIEQVFARDNQSQFSSAFTEKKKEKKFELVHLTFAKQQRQTAVEALFYLSYQTQFEVNEVGALIDLVRDLTNGMNGAEGLPLLDPFVHVPSAYEDQPQVEQPWAPYQSNLPPQKERKPLAWERLLVKQQSQAGLPELLRCVSGLAMAVISAMDTKHTLLDRAIHRENTFGMGNKLFPPGETSARGLEPIESRLNHESVGKWRRTDICGLFCGAYAMLRSATAVQAIGSPRAGGSSPSKVLARHVGYLLTSPMDLKSITFARLCLLPALQRPSLHSDSLCDSSEFMLSVLSDFVACFIDLLSNSGSLPGSRATWKLEQEEGLALQREQQKQQREFNIWSGSYQQGQQGVPQDTPVPTSVDILKRPDRLDDIITLAVSIASLGPEFAAKFWSTTREADGTIHLAPSKTLKTLKTIISEDESLTAYYYAFLAALAAAESGSDVVNSILTSPSETRWHWDHILETLRWYFRQFDRSRPRTATSGVSTGANSTSYYYRNVSVASTSQEAKALAKSQEPLPLGNANTFWMLSLLGLLQNATKSPSARLAILSKQLPIRAENSGTVLGNDTTLNILFSLLTAPITPDIRGAITKTISSLLSMEGMEKATEEDKAKMRQFCFTAWELVESCQILPILMLDEHIPATGNMNRSTSGLQFPASSTSLAGSGATGDSMIPVDKSYAILFEMEHVESHVGVYPSSEGFLCLLNSLFSSGCPATLGQQWRLRTGCSPYIEYVVHFVLPRATGSISSTGKLPFRTKADEVRLVALALQVVETVLVRYSFTIRPAQPSLAILPGQSTSSPTVTETFNLLGHHLLAEKVVDTNASNCTGVAGDFENKTVTYGQGPQSVVGFTGIQNQGLSQPFRGPAQSSIPAPKSPGFIVLANILSASDAEILLSLATVLGGSTSTSFAVGNEASKFAEVYALYGELPPTTSSAKHAGKTKDTISSSMKANQLDALRPGFFKSSSTYSEAMSWREQVVMHALQIICAAAAREEKFYAAVNASLQALRIVPSVRFNKRPGLTSPTQNVHLKRLKDVLLASNKLVTSVVYYVGHDCSTEFHDVSVAMSGLSILYFIDHLLPTSTSLETELGRNSKLSDAVARRLSISFDRCNTTPDSQILSLILKWILSDLRKGKRIGFAHALFEETVARRDRVASGRKKDCFGAILEMLNDHSFISDVETSGFAASCFEILARFCDTADANDQESFRRVVYTMDRLRASFFWQTKLNFFLSCPGSGKPSMLQSAVESGNPNLIHSLAFLLEGVASELHMLSGFSPPMGELSNLVGYIAPRLGERNALFEFLFGSSSEGVSDLVKDLPIKRFSVDNSAKMPPQEVIRSAMQDLQGSADVVSGYKVVDETLLLKKVSELYGSSSAAQADEFLRWSQSWNMAVKLDCAATHLSDVLRSLVGVSLASYDSERAIPSDTLARLLTSILGRLSVSEAAQLSPTATNNLSFMASLLTQQVVYPGSANSIPVADLRRVRDLLARAVVQSGKHPNGAEARRYQERTAILSAALVEIMQIIPGDETEIDHNMFLAVAHTLARLAVVVEWGQRQGTVVPTEATYIARSSLATLVQIWDQDIESPNQSLAFTFLSQTSEGASKRNAEFLLERLSSLDEGVVTLVETLLSVPFVGDALLQQGLMRALIDAADVYLREEARLQQSMPQGASGRKIAIGFPSCLLKHFALFRVLMATTKYLSDVHTRELPIYFSQFLDKYRHVIERTFTDFASHPEELRVIFQCIAQASTLLLDTSQSAAHYAGSPFQPVSGERTFRGSSIENTVQQLSLHLAEHPVPKDWLPDLPHSLGRSEKAVTSQVVSVTEDLGSSWWERFETVKRNSLGCTFEEFSEDMWKHALVGAEVLKAGLIVLMNLGPKNLEVEVSFVRGLFLLSTTAQFVETQVYVLEQSSQVDFMDTDVAKVPLNKRANYLNQYGRVLSTCIERLLLVLLGRVKMFLQEPENRLTDSVARYCKAVSDTLSRTELEGKGVPCSAKEGQERGKLLASALRKHIQDGGPQAM